MTLYANPTPATANFNLRELLTVGQEVPLIEGSIGNFQTTNQSFALAGIPDGLGLLETKDYNYLFLNHEIADVDSSNKPILSSLSSTTPGVIQGGRVSLLVFDKQWNPIGGKNLIDRMVDSTGTYTLDVATGKYISTTNGNATFSFSRFCSAYLASYGFVDSNGREVPVFFSAEESPSFGRGFASFPNGEAQAIEGLGRFAKENVVAASQYRATNSDKTVLFSTEDFTDGELYMWVGRQTDADPNGFHNGDLYVLRVGNAGQESQIPKAATTASWVKVDPATVQGQKDGKALQSFVNGGANSTNFRRLEDFAEDPTNPGTFYVVSTGTEDTVNSTKATTAEGAENPYGRLYRFSLNGSDPAGPIDNFELMLTGGPGRGVNYDNITVTRAGQVLLQEDETAFGGDVMLAEKRESQILAFDPKTRSVTPWFSLNESAAGAQFNKVDVPGEWESSGIITSDRRDQFVFTVMAHTVKDPKYVEGGQLILATPPANDVLTGMGGETVYGNQGHDRLISGGGGRNTLRGGKGNDTLVGGARDQLFGELGDDVLIAGSSSTLTGGEGRDRFVVTDGSLPAGMNTIADFRLDQDSIVFQGTVGRLSGLQLSATGADTVIRVDGIDVVTVNGVLPAALGAQHFKFE